MSNPAFDKMLQQVDETMSNVVKLRPNQPDPEPTDIVDTSAEAMERLALWEAEADDVADLQLKRHIADRAIKKGISSTVQLLRQEIKDLLAWKASQEALSHD